MITALQTVLNQHIVRQYQNQFRSTRHARAMPNVIAPRCAVKVSFFTTLRTMRVFLLQMLMLLAPSGPTFLARVTGENEVRVQ